jgi:hypothetical protein
MCTVKETLHELFFEPSLSSVLKSLQKLLEVGFSCEECHIYLLFRKKYHKIDEVDVFFDEDGDLIH